MKLRQIPEDFIVRELSAVEPSKTPAKYKLYLLEKTGLETFSLVRYLSKENNIPQSQFGIAGIKDRHAVTSQYFTIPAKYEIMTLKEQNFSIKLLGYSEKRLKAGDLKGNSFEITVRDLGKKDIAELDSKVESLASHGVPNYFDSQRFGSVFGNDFIAKHLIKKDYEGAVKIFLTNFPESENSVVKNDKRMLSKNWGDLSRVHVKTRSLSRVVEAYNRTGSWLSAYKAIEPELREMFVSAYQSHLWNECVKKVLESAVPEKNLISVGYAVGSLYFYKTLSEAELKKIPRSFSTIGARLRPVPGQIEVISSVLEKEGIALKNMSIPEETGNFFKAIERTVIIKPWQFKASQPEIDELNDNGQKNVFKVKISFTLPRGSYATIIIKMLFGQ